MALIDQQGLYAPPNIRLYPPIRNRTGAGAILLIVPFGDVICDVAKTFVGRRGPISLVGEAYSRAHAGRRCELRPRKEQNVSLTAGRRIGTALLEYGIREVVFGNSLQIFAI